MSGGISTERAGLDEIRARAGAVTVIGDQAWANSKTTFKLLRDVLSLADRLEAAERERDAAREQLRMELDEGLTVDEIMTGPVALSKIGGVNVKLLKERKEALVHAERLEEALRALVEDYEESDPYPTSDRHPLYAARSVLLHPEEEGS